MTPPTPTAPLTAESKALLARLNNRDDLNVCSDCTVPEGPCVDHIQVLDIVEQALPAIEAAARQPLLDEVARLREALVPLVPDDPRVVSPDCDWCDYAFIGKNDHLDPERHADDCWWVKARAALRDGGER